MKKTLQHDKGTSQKISPEDLEEFKRKGIEHMKRAWTWWEHQDEPVSPVMSQPRQKSSRVHEKPFSRTINLFLAVLPFVVAA